MCVFVLKKKNETTRSVSFLDLRPGATALGLSGVVQKCRLDEWRYKTSPPPQA